MTPPDRPGSGVEDRIATLAARYDLGAEARRKLLALTQLLVSDPIAPTSIKAPRAVLDDHLADSLVALESPAVRDAEVALDLGAGAGLPGLPLAIALPRAQFTLLESSARKCRFLESAVESCGIPNAEVVHARAESFAAGRGRYDLVTVRAVAPLGVAVEYAAPLLRVGGALIVWRGRREPELEAAAARAALELGLTEPVAQPVRPYPGAQHRHLHVMSKTRETPARFPRRPGIALKRPLGAKVGRAGAPSDRVQR